MNALRCEPYELVDKARVGRPYTSTKAEQSLKTLVFLLPFIYCVDKRFELREYQ